MIFSCHYGTTHRRINDLYICLPIIILDLFSCWLYLIPGNKKRFTNLFQFKSTEILEENNF